MEMRHLNYFYTVSKLGNFTHAANHLHVSQPSITHAIQQLEEELGVKLFTRTTKNVSLTSQGQNFFKRVETILADIKTTISDVKELNGKLKLGLPPMIGARIFPSIYVEYKKLYPHDDVEVREAGSLATCRLLEKGEVDLGFAILPEESDVLQTVALIDDEIMVCVPPSHPLAQQKTIDFSLLKNESFILLSEDFCHRKMTLELCKKHGFEPHVIFETSHVDTAKELVASGLGISLFMKMMVLNRRDIVPIKMKNPMIINMGLVWKKDKFLSPNCKKWIDFSKSFFSGAAVS